MDISRRQLLAGASATAIAAVVPLAPSGSPYIGMDFGSDEYTVITMIAPDGRMLEMFELQEKLREQMHKAFDVSHLMYPIC